MTKWSLADHALNVLVQPFVMSEPEWLEILNDLDEN